jgi:hypothetical protein
MRMSVIVSKVDRYVIIRKLVDSALSAVPIFRCWWEFRTCLPMTKVQCTLLLTVDGL